MKRFIIALLSFCCFLLSGCVYHLDVKQGNLLRADQIKQLKRGMTKSQVENLLGAPVLNNDFNDNCWYYVYTFQAGNSFTQTKKSLVIQFDKNERVAKIYDHYPTN